jgi:hypothetical protein
MLTVLHGAHNLTFKSNPALRIRAQTISNVAINRHPPAINQAPCHLSITSSLPLLRAAPAIGFPTSAPMAATVYPIPILVLYSDLSCVMLAIVAAGKDTRPPVTKQNVALMTISPDKVCTKRHRKRIIAVAKQHGTRIAIPPYLYHLVSRCFVVGDIEDLFTYMSAR